MKIAIAMFICFMICLRSLEGQAILLDTSYAEVEMVRSACAGGSVVFGILRGLLPRQTNREYDPMQFIMLKIRCTLEGAGGVIAQIASLDLKDVEFNWEVVEVKPFNKNKPRGKYKKKKYPKKFQNKREMVESFITKFSPVTKEQILDYLREKGVGGIGVDSMLKKLVRQKVVRKNTSDSGDLYRLIDKE